MLTHSEILYPALATALEETQIYGDPIVDPMKLMKLSVCVELQILEYRSAQRQYYQCRSFQKRLWLHLRSLFVTCSGCVPWLSNSVAPPSPGNW